MKYLKTAAGQIASLGLGTWKMNDGVGYDAVKEAIQMGYRHIDCAWIYLNEADIGRAISDCVKEGVVKRDDLWITSKLWNDKHHPDHIVEAFKGTLNDLQLDYLDLYLIHWPVAHQYGIARPESADQFVPLKEIPLTETWQGIVQLREQGLVREVGVSNFSRTKIENLIETTGICPSFNQVECHPYHQQQELLEYCQSRNILMTAYSPLGSGDRPEGLKTNEEPNLFRDEVLKSIAKKHSISIGQVMLAWSVNRGTIPIPKAASQDHLKQNLAAADIVLDETEMEAIAKLEKGFRFVNGTFWELPGNSYTVKELWA